MTDPLDPVPAPAASKITRTADVVIETVLDQLIEYAYSGSAYGLSELIDQGADVNMQDEYGWTPLHHAASRGARQSVRVLVASGKCDYLIRTHDGHYAFEIARTWGRSRAIANLLEKKHVQQAARLGVPSYIPRGQPQSGS